MISISDFGRSVLTLASMNPGCASTRPGAASKSPFFPREASSIQSMDSGLMRAEMLPSIVMFWRSLEDAVLKAKRLSGD